MIKIGTILICIQTDDEPVDLGMSGIVLHGTKGLKIGNRYKVLMIDKSQIPNNKKFNGIKPWTIKKYESVKQYWTRVSIRGIDDNFFTASIFIANLFKIEKT